MRILAAALLLCPFIGFSQYGIWEGDNEKQILEIRQRLEADSTIEKGSDLLLWCDYRLECYRDSIVRTADVTIFNGKEQYFEPSPNNKYKEGYLERRNIVLRRRYTSEGFLDWKILQKVVKQFQQEEEELKRRFNQENKKNEK